MTTDTRRSLRGSAAAAPEVSVSRASRTGRLLGDLLLWLAAAAGAVCILLVVLALTSQISLILFRTGSMSPTIPAGSVAVVQRVPAERIAVGDVVTVDRDGELPVTHRVTSVEPGASDGERVLTMRGDANATEDPFPYTVSSARVVLFAVPGVAAVISGLGNPVVLGALTLGATALVVWAFWPRAPRRPRAEGGPS